MEQTDANCEPKVEPSRWKVLSILPVEDWLFDLGVETDALMVAPIGDGESYHWIVIPARQGQPIDTEDIRARAQLVIDASNGNG